MALLLIITLLLITYVVAYPVLSLCRNYISARKTGLCLLVSPIPPYTKVWQIAASQLRPVLCHFRWFRAIDWTCAWHDDDKLHDTLGSCFIVVSSGLNVLCTSNPKTIEHVLKKWREFVKPDNVNGEYEKLSRWHVLINGQKSWVRLGRMLIQ
jgi:hypothetical protein